MLEDIIKNRMILAGLTQAKLAEMSGCTANQMGLFLKGSGFLNKASLEKCMSGLGIRLDIYDKRFQLVQKAALILKKYNNEAIIKMSKSQMIELTGIWEISSLLDVTESELDDIVSSGIVDYESTYPYFKAMVLHVMQIGDKSSPKTVETSFTKLAIAVAITPMFIPFLGITSIIGMATGILLGNKIYSSFSSNAMSPLMVLTKQLVKKH